MRPPLKEHRVADQLEPGREFEAWVFEFLFQVVRSDILCGLYLVLVRVQINVGLDKEDVVDCVKS